MCFSKLTESRYEEGKTLNDIIYSKIFYKVIDGFEYQLITLQDMWECFKHEGIQVSEQDKICIEQFSGIIFQDVIKVTIIRSYLKVKSVSKFLEELGIVEKLPLSNQYLDYSQLDIASVRLINKINKYMEENKVDTVENFLGESNIENYEVISSKKTEKLKIIHNKR